MFFHVFSLCFKRYFSCGMKKKIILHQKQRVAKHDPLLLFQLVADNMERERRRIDMWLSGHKRVRLAMEEIPRARVSMRFLHSDFYERGNFKIFHRYSLAEKLIGWNSNFRPAFSLLPNVDCRRIICFSLTQRNLPRYQACYQRHLPTKNV